VSAFKGVEVSNAIMLYISQGNEDAVAVSCTDVSDNKKIKTEVKMAFCIFLLITASGVVLAGKTRKSKLMFPSKISNSLVRLVQVISR